MEKQDPFEYWSEEEWDRNKLEVPKIKKWDIKRVKEHKNNMETAINSAFLLSI